MGMAKAKETLSSLRQLCAREWRALLVLVLANVCLLYTSPSPRDAS